MVFKYRILSGEEVLCEGAIVAVSLKEARAKIFKKMPRQQNGLKIEIKDNRDRLHDIFRVHRTDPGTGLYEKPVAKKVDNRPKLPWD